MSQLPPNPPPDPPPFRRPAPRAPRKSTNRSRLMLAGAIVALTLASLAGWAVSETGLNNTGLYFIGIPGLTAAFIAVLPSETGSRAQAMRMTLIILLSSALIVREGIICVLMASPLIFLIVFFASHPPGENSNRTMVFILPLLLLGSAEGLVFDFSSQAVAVEERVIVADVEQVESALGAVNEVPSLKPLLFKLPFPKPTAFANEGAELGDQQAMWFGDLVMRTVVAERTDNSLTWVVVEDTTPIGQWYSIDRIDVTWEPQAGGNGDSHSGDGGEPATDVALTVAITYERKLAPAIYFDPLGRLGLGSLADVMVDMVEAGLAGAELPSGERASR